MVAATLHAQILLPFPCIRNRNASEAYGGAGTNPNGRYTTDLSNGPILNGGDVRIPKGNVHFPWEAILFYF